MVNQAAIEQLKQLGFNAQLPPTPQRLIVDIAGPEKSGKSHLALTGIEPIIYFSIDKGTEGVVEKFQQSGKQVLVYEIRYPIGKDKADYTPIWAAFRQALDAALTVGEGTIVFDTWSEIYELARLAHFGRLVSVPPTQYPQCYPDLRMILDDIYSTRMSAALLTKMMPAFESRIMEKKGFNETKFKVQTSVSVGMNMVVENEGELAKPVWSLKVDECRQNAGMTGMTFTSKQVSGDGSVQDYFNLSTIIHLIHNWKI